MDKSTGSSNNFWPSYVDLMTSLFVIMLVLFILSYVNFTRIAADLAANAKQMERIRQIDKSLQGLDHQYFRLDKANNRYKLLVDVSFAPNKSDIVTIKKAQLDQLIHAGDVLYHKMEKLSSDHDINYMLIVEGNAEIAYYNGKLNSQSDPARGYFLSYQRALALKTFWQEQGYNFNRFSNCEILIVGSGYFGKSRDKDESNNKRFTIQITPKFRIDD